MKHVFTSIIVILFALAAFTVGCRDKTTDPGGGGDTNTSTNTQTNDPGDSDTGGTAGVSFESVSSGTLIINNESAHNLVVFKGTLSPSSVILGGVPAGASNHRLARYDGEYTIRIIRHSDYSNTPTSPGSCPEVFSSLVFVDDTARYVTVSESIGGNGRVIIDNASSKNVEVRLQSWDGQRVAYLLANETGKTIYLNPGDYDFFPIYRVLREGVVTSLKGSDIMTRQVTSGGITLSIAEPSSSEYAVGYVKLVSAYNNGLRFLNGATLLYGKTGEAVLNPGKTVEYEIKGGADTGLTYSTLKLQYTAGSFSFPSVEITNGCRYTYSVNSDGSVSILQAYEIGYSNANLADIKVDGVSLPSFNPSNYTYTVSIAPGTTTVSIIATPENPRATVSGAGGKLITNNQTEVVSVLARDGVTSNGYALTFTENELPTVSITTPTNNAVFGEGGYVSFTASASDTDGSVSSVEYYADGVFLGSASSSPYAFTWSNVSLGTYTLSARAVDSEGGMGTSSDVSVTVTSNVFTFVEMVAIPAGTFTMGSPASEPNRDSAEGPQHSVTLSAFYMGKYEVTYAEWTNVKTWATANGYSFNMPGDMGSVDYGGSHVKEEPVTDIEWYDVVKWCNALSEREGRTPCYYTTSAKTTVYRTGSVDVANDAVDWSANGYRLPTEAEWEYACRAGTTSAYYWGASMNGDYCWYDDNGGSSTHPVGEKVPNAWGLYDMSGNVWEWCHDWYGSYSSSPDTDPRGPASGTRRVLRGGRWGYYAQYCRSAYRGYDSPSDAYYGHGFRVVTLTP